MPYDIRKNKGGGYTVKSKVSGRVAHVKTKANLRGYLWHSEHGAGNGSHIHRAVDAVRKELKHG